MARKVKSAILDTRTARLSLTASPKPHYVRLHDNLHLGYRKGARKETAGKWVARRYLGDGKYTVEVIGTADDRQIADGANILTFDQAQEAARANAVAAAEGKRRVDAGPPVTVRSAVTNYLAMRDLRAAGHSGKVGTKSDASYRLAKHVLSEGSVLADLALIDLTRSRLREWRRNLEGLSASAVDRTVNDFKAALNAAMNDDEKDTFPSSLRESIREGLRGTAEAEPSSREMQILPDADVRAVVVAAEEIDREDGWDGSLHRLIVVLAATGARFSQARRLSVADVQSAQERIMMPVSRKGRGKKQTQHIAVRIGADVLEVLEAVVAGRKGKDVLLLRPKWERQPGGVGKWKKADRPGAWENAYDLRNEWEKIRTRAGLSADAIPYALRHSSIVRGLRQGLPTRLVAALHDTSSAMIEKYYSAYIVDAMDELSARAVVPLVTTRPTR